MLRGLLASRGFGLGVVGFVSVYLLMAMAGVNVYQCPFHQVSGLSCPGCGLSRAGHSLLKGEFAAMFRQHPFAPYFAILGGTLAVAAVLPGSSRNRWVAGVVRFEQYTLFHAVFLVGAAVFGAARLLWQLVRFV